MSVRQRGCSSSTCCCCATDASGYAARDPTLAFWLVASGTLLAGWSTALGCLWTCDLHVFVEESGKSDTQRAREASQERHRMRYGDAVSPARRLAASASAQASVGGDAAVAEELDQRRARELAQRSLHNIVCATFDATGCACVVVLAVSRASRQYVWH